MYMSELIKLDLPRTYNVNSNEEKSKMKLVFML